MFGLGAKEQPLLSSADHKFSDRLEVDVAWMELRKHRCVFPLETC